MRGSTCAGAALALLCLLPLPVAAGAVPIVGTAQYAAPARGSAVVVPSWSDRLAEYTPFPGRGRSIIVFARLRAGQATTRVLVKHKAARGRCARSFAADGGIALRMQLGRLEPGGYLTAASRPGRWRLVGARRFCVWPTASPRRRVAPSSSVVRFVRGAVGAVHLPLVDDGVTGVGVLTLVAATTGYRLTWGREGCPGDALRTQDVRLRSPFAVASAVSFTSHDDRCDYTEVVGVESSLAPTISLRLKQSEATAGGIVAAGDCVFEDIPMRPDIARALVRRQGCRIGRTLRVRDTGSTAVRGWVADFTVNGAPAGLVPRGTRVDLAVHRP